MVLKCIRIQKLRARAVAENQTVGRRAVVVGGREALIMQASRTAGRKDDGLCPRDEQLLRLHVQEHRTRAVSVFVLDKLNGGGEVHDLNILVIQHLVAQRPHDLRAGVVLGGVHTLAGGTAAVGRNHGAVGCLVEFHTKLRQPLDGLRRVHDELVKKILLRGEVAAAVGIQKMLRRGIVRLICRLNAALGHHGVGVAHAELRDEQHLCTRFLRLDGRRAAGAAAADDEHVRVIVRIRQIGQLFFDAGLSLEQRRQLQRNLAALARADAERCKLVLTVIGMERPEQNVLLLRSHAARVKLCIFLAVRLHQPDGFLNFRIGIHGFSLLTFRSHDGCKAP